MYPGFIPTLISINLVEFSTLVDKRVMGVRRVDGGKKRDKTCIFEIATIFPGVASEGLKF